MPGIGSLQQFLNVPDKYNLKYIFSNDQFYDPLLFFYGWHRLQFLENGIAVWERSDTPVLPEVLPRREIPLYQRLMFGILPPLALLLSVIAVTSPYWQIPLLVIGEALGIRPHLERVAGRLAKPFHWLWRSVDRRLLTASELTGVMKGRAPRWQLYLRRSRQRMRRPSPQARQIRLAVLGLGLLLTLVLVGVRIASFFFDPIYLITSYYDNLDFRRFEKAYAQLNPTTRPDFEQYLLNLSVGGGLVASYSKLDSLTTTVLQATDDAMQVQVDTRYITALSYYTNTQVLALTQLPSEGWRIEPSSVDNRVPPGQFLRQPTVNWLAQSRSRVTSDVPDFVDALDRPELQILSAQLVARQNGHYSAVGEVMNRDVDPADVTVSAYIYDDQDQLLTWYNAGAGMMHKLFPLEITPFRIDFEGVAGLALKDAHQPVVFAPGETWDYTLPTDKKLGHYAVFAKAVVTQRDLNREVGVQALQATASAAGLQLQGTLVNAGLKEAVIPHLLVTLYDEAGRVVWVDHFFISESIRPQRTLDFAVDLTPRQAIDLVEVEGDSYTNALDAVTGLSGPRQDFLELPPDTGYQYLRVSVHYFAGEN